MKNKVYRLKQSRIMWNKDISSFLKSINMKQNKANNDKCLFDLYNIINKKLTTLLTLFIDDILIDGEDQVINYIIINLKKKKLNMYISKESKHRKNY